jgi:hypothetical protein
MSDLFKFFSSENEVLENYHVLILETDAYSLA